MTTTTSTYDPGGRPRRLERSRDDRWIAGVCGGLGNYLGIDPVIVRLAVVALLFAGGVGVIVYLAALLLVPEEGAAGPILRRGFRGGDRPWIIAGAVLLGIGAISVINALGIGWGGDVLWSLALLAGGAYLLLRYTDVGRSLGLDLGRKGTASPATPVSDPAPLAGDPLEPASPTSGPAPVGGDPLDPATEPTVPLDPATAPFQPPTATAAPRRRRRRRATGIALGALLLVVGGAGLLLAAGAYDLRVETFIAGAVMVTGIAVVVSAWFGGAPALIWLGLGTAAVLGVATAANVNLSAGAGDRVYEPATAAAVKRDYELGAGRLWIDLRNTELPAGTTTINADLGLGELTVVAPDGVHVQAKGSAGAGNVRLLGRNRNGTDVKRTVVDTPPGRPGRASPRRLVIDGHVGLGEVRVFRGQGAPRPQDVSNRETGSLGPPVGGGRVAAVYAGGPR